MVEGKLGSDINLRDLRGQLTNSVALMLLVVSGLLIWRVLSWEPFSIVLFGLFVMLFIVAWGVRGLANERLTLARHLLVWSLTAIIVIGMEIFSEPWLPFLGLILIFISGMLIQNAEFATAGIIAAAVFWLAFTDGRDYPLFELIITLIVTVALTRMIVHTLYTALGWSWTMYQRAESLLNESRDRQVELSRVLKSLDAANINLRRTQSDLINARRQAEEARLLKEQFAANVSHELRTPLNLILGFSQMLYLSPEVYGDIQWPPKLRRAVYQIYNSSQHLLEMIDDVLSLSRFEITGFTLNKEPTPLEPLLREALEIAGELFSNKQVSLKTNIAPDLPTLELDRTRVRQVFLNLLNNAARFTEKGTVEVIAKRTGNEVMISVNDTGPGIPDDKLPHTFDEFYQIDRSLHRKHGGVGLGLAISKQFVEAHKGRIWVESQVGVGSSFIFSLPIPGKYISYSEARSEHLPDPALWPEIRKLVLVIDPDPTIVTLVDQYLKNYDTIQVSTLDRLEEAIMTHHPKAVIYNVPPGKQIGDEDVPAIPVPFVLCSLPSRVWLANDLKVSACLTKPVTVEGLLQEIERLGKIRRVLVIDDERGFCQLVEQMLETTGRVFEVSSAYSGTDGLQVMRSLRPDLVLLDLAMPHMDGFEVLEAVKQDAALLSIPIILLTIGDYIEDALQQHSGPLVIRQPGGLSPTQVLYCVQAAVDVLKPHY